MHRHIGELYVGRLGQIAFVPELFPSVPDFEESFRAGIYRLSRDGRADQVASGLHAVLSVAFDQQHRMYSLQSPIFMRDPAASFVWRPQAMGDGDLRPEPPVGGEARADGASTADA